jgi:glycosyltransferase involved in cell wall biosynthesis
MQKLGPAFELRYTTGLRTRQSDPIPANMQPLGWLDETGVIRAYQECDALLFPSRFEGFGYVALEAMACGKPVVASNSSALPEVVENGVTGILCEPDNIDAFVEACSRLACNPALCACMGEAARKRVTRSFSEEAIVPLYIRLFNSLTNQGHANPIDRRAV